MSRFEGMSPLNFSNGQDLLLEAILEGAGFISTLSAVLRSLGLVERAIHCKDEGLKRVCITYRVVDDSSWRFSIGLWIKPPYAQVQKCSKAYL